MRSIRRRQQLRDHREIRKLYSKSEGKMVDIPKDIRPAMDAYKAFKRPAFDKVNRKGSVKSESKFDG